MPGGTPRSSCSSLPPRPVGSSHPARALLTSPHPGPHCDHRSAPQSPRVRGQFASQPPRHPPLPQPQQQRSPQRWVHARPTAPSPDGDLPCKLTHQCRLLGLPLPCRDPQPRTGPPALTSAPAPSAAPQPPCPRPCCSRGRWRGRRGPRGSGRGRGELPLAHPPTCHRVGQRPSSGSVPGGLGGCAGPGSLPPPSAPGEGSGGGGGAGGKPGPAAGGTAPCPVT